MNYPAAEQRGIKSSFRKAQRAYPESKRKESSHRVLDYGSRPAVRVLAGMTNYDTVSFAGMTVTPQGAEN
jgi:hypothetical protein